MEGTKNKEMRKILILLAMTFLFWTISLMVEGQTTKGQFTEMK